MARFRLSTLGACRASAVASLVFTGLSGCSGDVVNLGSSEPLMTGGDAGAAGSATAGSSQAGGGASAQEWTPLPAPVLVQEIGVAFANGTLTHTLDLFFTHQDRGDAKVSIYWAQRAGQSWVNPTPLVFADATVEDASSPAISPDGNELWFGSMSLDMTGTTDIWFSGLTGDTWSKPVNVETLNSLSHDVPRPPAVLGTIMPLSSKRHGGERYQIYLATREVGSTSWSEPTAELLTSVNSSATETVDGFLTEDGLTLYFAATHDDPLNADLYRAQRTAADQAFGQPEPLSGLQTNYDERDPWLSADGITLYYSSNHSGNYAIYRAMRAR